MGNKEMYYKEYAMLREELHDLKSCQVTFLTFSITATALLLGVIEKLSPTDSRALFYFIPLIILLPSWCIFFEKATTITRIVGYNRILEMLILNDNLAANFIGWENTLAEIRKKEKKGERGIEINQKKVKFWNGLGITEKLDFLPDIFGIRLSYRYWPIVYDVFCVLSWLCLALSLVMGFDYLRIHQLTLLAYIIPIAVIAYVSWNNVKMAYELSEGKHSYTVNEHRFKEIIIKKDSPSPNA